MKPPGSAKSILIAGIWGIVAGGSMGGLTPVLALGEMSGPISFAIPFAVLAIVFLGVTIFTARAEGVGTGLFCGLAFSVPIAVACYLIATVDPIIEKWHGRELAFVSFMTLGASLVMMILTERSRR